MRTEYEALPDSTRVWVYQSSRPFPESVVPAVKIKIRQFVEQWISHNRMLRAHGDLLYGRFVVLMVDESRAGASGCSIDTSVRFLHALQTEYGVDLFDRMAFSYKLGEAVHTVPATEFSQLYQAGVINDDTLVFDTLVNNKGDLDRQLLKPLSESWHKRMIRT